MPFRNRGVDTRYAHCYWMYCHAQAMFTERARSLGMYRQHTYVHEHTFISIYTSVSIYMWNLYWYLPSNSIPLASSELSFFPVCYFSGLKSILTCSAPCICLFAPSLVCRQFCNKTELPSSHKGHHDCPIRVFPMTSDQNLKEGSKEGQRKEGMEGRRKEGRHCFKIEV